MPRIQQVLSRYVLMTMACVFLLSGLLRLGPNAGFAADLSDGSAVEDPVPELTKEVINTPRLVELLKDVRAREEKLEKAELKLLEEKQKLDVLKEEIRLNLVALEEAEARLRSTLALADGAAEVDLSNLTKVYENMKPKDAAALFSAMDPKFAAGFLSRMQPVISAAILSGMEPEFSYQISVILAGRNTDVPTE